MWEIFLLGCILVAVGRCSNTILKLLKKFHCIFGGHLISWRLFLEKRMISNRKLGIRSLPLLRSRCQSPPFYALWSSYGSIYDMIIFSLRFTMGKADGWFPKWGQTQLPYKPLMLVCPTLRLYPKLGPYPSARICVGFFRVVGRSLTKCNVSVGVSKNVMHFTFLKNLMLFCFCYAW
jgi:hypothetical protein